MLVADAPAIWLPPAPAIIRPADDRLLKPSFWPASRLERRAALKELVATGRISREQARETFVWFAPGFFFVPKNPASFVVGGTLAYTSGATNTWTNVSIGPADAGRYVVVGLGRLASSGAAAPTSLTIGGVAATRIGFSQATNAGVVFFIALVPTGTTATIVLSNPSSAQPTGGVWAVYDLLSPIPTTAMIYDSSSPYSQSITIQPGGVAFGAILWSSGKRTTTWTGLVESFEDTSGAQTAGSGAALASTSGATVTAVASPSGSTTYGAMGVLALR